MGGFQAAYDLGELADVTLADHPEWTPSCRIAFDRGRHSAQRTGLLLAGRRWDIKLQGGVC